MFYKVHKLTKDFVDNYNDPGARPVFEGVVYINRQQIVSISGIDGKEIETRDIMNNKVIVIKLSNGEVIETMASDVGNLLNKLLL